MQNSKNEIKYLELLIDLYIDDKSEAEFFEALRNFARFLNTIPKPIRIKVNNLHRRFEDQMDIPFPRAIVFDSQTLMEVHIPMQFRGSVVKFELQNANDECFIRMNKYTTIVHRTQGLYSLQAIWFFVNRIIMMHRKMEAGWWTTAQMRLDYCHGIPPATRHGNMYLPVIRVPNLTQRTNSVVYFVNE